MTNNQLTSTHLAVKSELDGYKIHASRGQATAMAMVRLFESIDRDLEELQERRQATMNSEPVAWRRFQETPNDGGYWILYDYRPNCSGAEPLYRHAQQPVVPENCPAEIRDLIDSHSDALFHDDDAQEIWNACRAAMLQELKKSAGTEATCRSNENALVLNTIKAPPALGSLPKIVEVQNTNSPVNDVTTGKPLTNGDSVTCKSLTSINPAPALVSLPKNAKSLTGNSPVIPDGSEHCPCCGKKLRRACSIEGCDGNHVAHGLCQKHYDMKRWEDPEQVERFREAGRRYRGKKKSTAATPQEPKP
ncbi:hypothetical protein [Klebsiella pneumoniae]|uniref:hypothetical protein n=1 Tax=Klebsiella pneumoniae TaxID=573 RepID=UPI00211DE064|nr:hypothetical protein [Klebsiella pneumoniae]